MADPWYEVVRPIWSNVVHILNRLTECRTLEGLLLASGVVTPENCSDFHIIESCEGFRLFPELYLVAVSLGGETSFTSFLSLLKSWAFPGSHPLAHELERLWTNAKKKHVPKKSTASSPLRKFCSSCCKMEKNYKPLNTAAFQRRSPVYLCFQTPFLCGCSFKGWRRQLLLHQLQTTGYFMTSFRNSSFFISEWFNYGLISEEEYREFSGKTCQSACKDKELHAHANVEFVKFLIEKSELLIGQFIAHLRISDPNSARHLVTVSCASTPQLDNIMSALNARDAMSALQGEDWHTQTKWIEVF